jgi:hypothetical protein
MNMLEICQVCITRNIASLVHMRGDSEKSWQKELLTELARIHNYNRNNLTGF